MDFGNLFIPITGLSQGKLLAATVTMPHRAALLHSISSSSPENRLDLSTMRHTVLVKHTGMRCLSRIEEIGDFVCIGKYFERWFSNESDVLSQEAELSASSSTDICSLHFDEVVDQQC